MGDEIVGKETGDPEQSVVKTDACKVEAVLPDDSATGANESEDAISSAYGVQYAMDVPGPTGPHVDPDFGVLEDASPYVVSRPDLLGVRLVSLVTFLSGLVLVVHPLFVRLSAHPKLFSALVPYSIYHWSRSLTSAFGLMLIYLSLNLYRRKRVAWILSVALTLFSVVNLLARIESEHLFWLRGSGDLTLPLFSLLPSLVALFLLWRWRRSFTVRSEPRGIHKAIKYVLLSASVAFLYGSLGFWLLDKKDFGIDFSWTDAMLRTWRELTLQGNGDLVAHTRHGASFLQSLRVIGTLSGVFSLYSLFRPLEYELSTLPRERARAHAILEIFGRSALDEMKLLPDKSYFFGTAINGFVAYKTVGSIAVALGDPVAASDEIPALTQQFVEVCHNNGWNVAFMQTTPDFLSGYKQCGLDVLKVGEDAVVDLEKFCSETIKAKTFKGPLRKFDKQGFKLERCEPPHAAPLIDSVQRVSDEWLSLPGRTERGFSLGQFDRAALQSHILYVLRDDKNEVIAFVDQIRSYRKGEVTIDMMRHRKEVPGGTMDYLFGKLLQALKEQGFTHFSLGLAALSGVGEQPDASLEEKAANLIYNKLNRFFSYKGLRAYKQKFEPAWEDRFLIYEGGPAGLVRTSAALIAAMKV